ncbi:MAG: DinB family protein [Acidobacteriia bacterium]|nr:DinB family protein [Terriglobia bacterium]
MNTKRVAHRVAIALALAALSGAAFSQSGPPTDLVGDWKASLEVNGTKLRLVFHVTQTESGPVASFDSLDQGAFGLPVDSVLRDGTRLHFEMSKLSARFDGEWNPSTLQFEGQWQQGSNRFPLSLKRAPATAVVPSLPMSDEDRQFLLGYLKKTEDGVIRSIAHLSASQWTYKPDPSRWSIEECVEHLVLEERTLFPAITQKVVKIPLPDGQARANREQDERIIQFMTDRSQKVSAGESVVPHGKLATVEEGIAQFSKVRGDTIEWVRTTQVDLRGHGTANPSLHFLDAYGYLVLLSAHSARHTAQMEEVKNAPGYPK